MEQITIQGMSLDELFNGFRNIVREEIEQVEKMKFIPIEKKQACELLDISYPTLNKIMEKENIDIIYASDIERLSLKYPKFKR